ncbi:AEC family transporter [Azorhizobium doebereinerae]|uniref:AEC family transporter n=1 Tax=Azorhizobium doebereinerae TaxID=281091 RepID=UPI000425FDFB|nr:AEC family transporter [Azorhizobium doebereinerae]
MLGILADLALIVLPVFGIVGLGYGASKTRLISDTASDGLAEYVFSLAVPILIFKTLSESKLPDAQPWGYWIAYFTGAFAVFFIASLAARKLFHRSHTEAVIHGFSAGQANTVFVGVPLILKAYGEEGAVPLFLLIAVHLPIMLVAATIAVEGGSGFSLATGKRLFRSLAFNPILLGIYAGGLGRLFGFEAHGVLKQVLDMMAASATPCALISLGLALKRYGVSGDLRPTALICGLKLIVHPLLVLGLTRILPMPPVWAGVAVLFAAMPCGINAYLLAQRYGVGVGTSSSAVSLSTALGLITITFWLYVLGVG